jgi:glycosyltransferase involved in cell wall biosynthesis
MEDILVRRYGLPQDRLTVIVNGVDTDFLTPTPPEEDGGPPVVLSVARLVPDKDLATLIKAFHLTRARHPEAELWLVGDGPRRPALEQLAREGDGVPRVKFFPSSPDLRPFWRRAGLLALSSVYEGLPNVVLEAMAAGLPVVATRVGGIPEAVVSGETGWLVPPRDVPGLAGALEKLLADPEARRSLGRAGRRRAEELFSFPAMVGRHEEAFARLLER